MQRSFPLLSCKGEAHRGCANTNGVAMRNAERAKQRTYPELSSSSRLALVTAAMEVGGRLNRAALELVELAATARARSEPAALRAEASRRWRDRWVVLLGVTAQKALARTLVDDGTAVLDGVDADGPLSVDLWLEHHNTPAFSRRAGEEASGAGGQDLGGSLVAGGCSKSLVFVPKPSEDLCSSSSGCGCTVCVVTQEGSARFENISLT